MKIDTNDDMKVTLELESPSAYQAFRMGMEDRKQWHRHPETQELSQYINDNHKFAQIVVKCGDVFQRVK